MKNGSVVIFNSISSHDGYPGYKEKSGQKVTIVRKLTDTHPSVGEMYHIKFKNGLETNAFKEELTPVRTRKPGVPSRKEMYQILKARSLELQKIGQSGN